MLQLLQRLPADVQGELFVSKSSALSASYANSEFEDIKNTSSYSATLRVIKDGRMALASSSKPQDDESLVDNALAIVRFGNEVNHGFPAAAPRSDVPLVDPRVREVDLQTMVDITEDLVAAVVNYDSRIKVMAGVTREEQRVELANSSGFFGSYDKTGWHYYLGGQLVQGDDMLWLYEVVTGCDLRNNYGALKAEVIDRFERAKTIVPFKAGTYPVIFAPNQVGYLLEPFLASLNGKAIMRDISPWKGKRGQKLLDERITIVDDGTLPYCASSVPFDREGVPTRRNTLIEQGVVRQEILDLESGDALGMDSTGNGTLTGPHPHHAILNPGTESVIATLKHLERGLIIYDTMGAWAGNPFSGNVSGTISLGLLIEKGEVVGRIKDCMFSINSFKHFRDHLIALSCETKENGTSTYPYVTLDDVVISTQ